MQGEVHDRLALPIVAPIGSHNGWEKVRDLQRDYSPVVKRIRFLAEKGLTSMMVLHDFSSKRIAPL
jgi:hypothetical protein